MKKKILSLICGVLILSAITGCGTVRRSNLVRKYADYWKYSLGEYTYDYKWGTVGSPGGLTSTKFKEYTFYYVNYNGEKKQLQLSNYNNDEEKNITTAFEKMLREELEAELQKYNFMSKKLMQNVEYTNFIIDPYVEVSKVDENISFFDSKNGVDIKNLRLSNAKKNNLIATIEFSIYLTKSISDYSDLKQDLIDVVSIIYDKYGYENIQFYFRLHQQNEETVYYYLKYNGYNYSWSEKRF